MPAIVFDIGVLIGILYLARLGSTVGVCSSAMTALELLVSLSLAVLLHEPIAGFLAPLLSDSLGGLTPGWLSIQAWSVFLSFALPMWGTMVALWLYVQPRIISAEIKSIEVIDTAAGALVGGFAGTLFIGAILVTWSMCPLLSYLRIPAQHMFLDAGKTALRAASRFADQQHEGRSLVLYGEPPSRESVPSSLLASETWYDSDANTEPNEHDPFYDADGNGAFTKDLYYEDVDGNRLRRVGLIEKYTVGHWDADALVSNRDRPDKVKAKTAAASRGQPTKRQAPAADIADEQRSDMSPGNEVKPPPTEPEDDF